MKVAVMSRALRPPMTGIGRYTLNLLQHIGGSLSPDSMLSGCPGIGSQSTSIFGDIDCDRDVDSVDALRILRHVAGLSVSPSQNCAAIGLP